MGRRSINTTKSGKYMNPTDQARKEARKKELKKNKKQRQMVRAAVLKGKDPQQLLHDLEKIDQMEYNVMQPSPLNEKVLKDKRKKLKETLDRVMRMYNKDDPDKWADLRRLQVEYERRRIALFSYFEAVKNAQQVHVDDIPMPLTALPVELQAAFATGAPSQIPLPAALAPGMLGSLASGLRTPVPFIPPPGILKKAPSYIARGGRRDPPGVPPGPPPELSDEDDEIDNNAFKKSIRFAGNEDNDNKEDDENKKPDQPKPTSLQQKMLVMAGQDIDHFMKEMEAVQKKRRSESGVVDEENSEEITKPGTPPPPPGTEPLGSVAARGLGSAEVSESVQAAFSESNISVLHPSSGTIPIPMMPGLGANTSGLGPGGLMFRPPPPPPRGMPPALMGIRLPPPGIPPRNPSINSRIPPGPPPGLPPSALIRASKPPLHGFKHLGLPHHQNVVSAAPLLKGRSNDYAAPKTIEAQPQIRNLSADITRFLPTSLRVKRQGKRGKAINPGIETNVEVMKTAGKPQNKDDAYKQFMREMQGLL